jgi:hypothetical protein
MLIEQMKQSIENNKPFFIKSYMDYDFDWEDVVNIISMSYNKPTIQTPESMKVPTSMKFNSKLNILTKLQIESPEGVAFHAQDTLSYPLDNSLSKKYHQIRKIKEDASLIDSKFNVNVKFSINMSENGHYLDPHRDDHHVILTQVIGKSKYVIHENIDSDPYGRPLDVSGRNFVEYDMDKNDLLFMPKGTIHSIDNSSIRVACIFDIFEQRKLHEG